MNPTTLVSIDELLEQVERLLNKQAPEAVESTASQLKSSDNVNFEELREETLRSAMLCDAPMLIDRYNDDMTRLFWDPFTAKDDQVLLRSTIYNRTALRLQGLTTVNN